MINKDLQLNWLGRQKEKIEALKKDIKAINDAPYFGDDLYQTKPKLKDVNFGITVSKPKLHWYSSYYEKTIDVKLSTPVAIETIKTALTYELKKAESIYNKCKDEDFQENNCFDYRDWYQNERELYPGCKNCRYGHCCELHFDFNNELKEEILNR